MNVTSFLWHGFSISEGGPFLNLSDREIQFLDEYLHDQETGPNWFRTENHIRWSFARGVDETTRRIIHTDIYTKLKTARQDKEVFLRWVGVKCVMTAVFSMNEHIQ